MTEPVIHEPAETYELIPAEQLDMGDVVYFMGRRQILRDNPWHSSDVGAEWIRLPVMDMDGTNEMAPPVERDHLLPVRVRPRRKLMEGMPHRPRRDIRDSTLTGLDLDDLLTRLRDLVGRGELIDPKLMRQLDDALSAGRPLPADWRHADYQALIRLTYHLQNDLARLKTDLTALQQELIGRQK